MKKARNLFENKIVKPLQSAISSLNSIKNKNLFCGIGTSQIKENSILIADYPFEPSLVYPQKEIAATEIVGISTDFGICKIHLDHDIIFISASKKSELELFVTRNNIKLTTHSWNWDWILEPYLDTELTPTNGMLITERLEENGLTKKEVQAIRNEIGDQMLKYNFDTILWEWCSLGIVDVLSAMRAKYNTKNFNVFYLKAIEIENRKKS